MLTKVYTKYILLLGSDFMESKLQKWGNSAGIRIPNSLLKSLNLKIDDVLELEQVENKIVVSKSNKHKISLEKLFKEYKGENLTKEFSWDEPQGKEIW